MWTETPFPPLNGRKRRPFPGVASGGHASHSTFHHTFSNSRCVDVACVRIQARSLPLSTALLILGLWEAELYLQWVHSSTVSLYVSNYTSLYWWSPEHIHLFMPVPCQLQPWMANVDCIPFHTQEQIGKSVTFQETYFNFLTCSKSLGGWPLWGCHSLIPLGGAWLSGVWRLSRSREWWNEPRLQTPREDPHWIELNWYGLRNGIRDIATALKWIQRSAKMHSRRNYIQSILLDL